ncbi:hypothetical protein FBEOM_8783 [Fusarium beomiforme]|uniref:Uncharacterized protein n=1 Tax=Fusarium beomiforme TaxID=44412 RepID=A0A9P5DWY0_9HYPO|nr:hypothetical protein FBEOM_8783 [Fusarium beomiforme]
MTPPTPKNIEADGKERFTALCEGIRRLETTPELLGRYEGYHSGGRSEPEFPQKTRRPHRFILDEDWNPWRDWYLYQNGIEAMLMITGWFHLGFMLALSSQKRAQ